MIRQITSSSSPVIALFIVSLVSSSAPSPAAPTQATGDSGASAEQETPGERKTRAEILREMREEKSRELFPESVSRWEARIRGWEEAQFPRNWLVKGWNGFRPVFGGMPSGSGFVLGAGYIHGLTAQYFQAQANARFSTRGYTMLDGEAVFPPPQDGRRVELKFRAQYRDLTSLRFYGLGNDSSVESQSFYQLEDTLFGGYAWLNPRGLLSFGAEGGFLRAETSSGSEQPSVGDEFPAVEIPGFDAPRTDYSVVGGWVEFDVRDKWEDPQVGLVARIAGLRYDDTVVNAFDFTRVVADVKGYVPLGPKSRILALRLRTSHSTADIGDAVPFYLMETLGGAKSIRGFNEFRFQDTRNLLVNVEYRWEVWTFADFAFFFDAGKVFADEEDFDFKDMHTGYGFGIRGHAPGDVTLRFDFAHSTEGFKFHISGGPSF